MPSLRRYGQNDPSSPLALFGLQRTPELLLYFKICCAPPPTALSLCLRLPSFSSSALFIPYLPPERALLADCNAFPPSPAFTPSFQILVSISLIAKHLKNLHEEKHRMTQGLFLSQSLAPPYYSTNFSFVC